MLKRFTALVLGFFALYVLTAQRGAGWGDSAEFQDWILHASDFVCGPHFSNAHPFYVAFARSVAGSPFAVNAVSALFGALSVGGFFLCARRLGLAVLFGLSHMLWWNSCIAEVQTMSLAFTAFETWCLLEGFGRLMRRDSHPGGWRWLAAAAFLSGLHLGIHNFAVLNAPVAAVALGCAVWRNWKEHGLSNGLLTAASWLTGASVWLYHLVLRGPADVLVGNYGGRVGGIWPENGLLTAFNLCLAGLSFLVPALLFLWNERRRPASPNDWLVLSLLAVNFVFFIRYFVPDQATFLLPTLFFAYLAISRANLGRSRLVALAALQLLLPVLAWQTLAQLPVPKWKTRHEGRDDARYFALPYRIFDSPSGITRDGRPEGAH